MVYPLGPASWPVWLRKLLPYSGRFANAANAHDFFYSRGGTERDRFRADCVFLEEMEDSIGRGWFGSTVCEALAMLSYFALVRSLGWAFFRYTETCGKLPKR